VTVPPATLDPMRKPLIEPWTVDEFLAWERAQEERYEFVDGLVRMMVGGTLAHARIKGNVYASSREQVGGSGCEVRRWSQRGGVQPRRPRSLSNLEHG